VFRLTCDLSLICRHETVLLNLKNKSDWLFERNPLGRVPILEHKGCVIYESAVCNEFLEEAYPGSSTGTRDLLPSCPYERAAVRLLMLKLDKVCILVLTLSLEIITSCSYHTIKYKCRPTIEQELVDVAAAASGICFVCTHQVAARFCVKWGPS